MKLFVMIFVFLLNTLLLNAEESVKAVLFPFREAVISARVESSLEPYAFKMGESFKQGDIIAALNDKDYALKLKNASEEMNFMQTVYLDKKELHEKKFTSDFELKKAEFEFRKAQNAYAAAQLNISYCKIKAPFAGKIVEFITREYETVRPGQPILRIIDDNQLLAVMNIPQNKIPANRSTVKIMLDNKIAVSGKIYEISPRTDHRTGTVRIRVLVDNSSGQLKAGMTGELINVE